ncbi:MAG: glycosyltransferase family 2 protein [Flavobacteriaceae bacterium]|nr:glycosyltransferase family 2 protein [Flavobacteriaceae bacterium]
MDISIISINYNNSALTQDFVKSVIACTDPSISYEIIIVDNCSATADYKNLIAVLADYKGVTKIVRSNINTGFGGGNMFGTQFAKGKYLAFINNDVIFTEDCLASLHGFMKDHPDVGVCTAQQLDKDKNPVAGFDYYHGIRKELLGRWAVELTSKKVKRENRLYTETVYPDFIQGCFLFFDTKRFAEAGGFDTNLFLYYEEMDICYRLKQNGLQCAMHPETKFIHLHGESTPKNFTIRKELKISYLYILHKNHSYFKYSVIRYYTLIRLFFKSFFKPAYWNLVYIILTSTYLEHSLRQKQVMVFPDED